jgi:hypothetical protein
MKQTLLLVITLTISQILIGQTKEDLLACIEKAFSAPEMEQFMEQEWGEVRTLYIVQRRNNINQMPFFDLLNQLDPSDFFGFPYAIELIDEQQEEQLLKDRSERSRSVISVSGQFREPRLSMTIAGPLPGDLRKTMMGSFVFEKEAGTWDVIQSHVQKYP